MNNQLVFLSLCALTVVLGASVDRQKRSVFGGIQDSSPLSQTEVKYYLKELAEIQGRLSGGSGSKSKKHRHKSSGKSSGRGKKGDRSWKQEAPWRAGMHWWERKHGKKSGSSSWSSSSSSSRCDQPIEYGNTDCTDHKVRYYYEKESKMCRKFHFTGCGGNQNNFHSKHDCQRKCKH